MFLQWCIDHKSDDIRKSLYRKGNISGNVGPQW